ncbi:hypothetical protein AGMMS49992_30170 [Clostridia bacterium]|nr:hypothetical protein AGMMS49992_30170 [Clostridia bacterium]
MEYVVRGEPFKINFGAAGVEEILQNVRMILTTPIFSVPLDRLFGLDFSMLDQPMPMAQARLSEEIFKSLRKYEPRVDILQIDFVQSTAQSLDGHMIPSVRVGVNAA